MKKWIMGITLLVVAIVGTIFVVLFQNISRENDEIISFREYLDENYYPVFGEFREELTIAAEKIDSYEYSSWYLNIDTIEKNMELQQSFKDIKEEIINLNIKYEDGLAYKKNILNQISITEELLEIMDEYPIDMDIEKQKVYKDMFINNVDKLSEKVEESHEILE
ncbi:hypothetical protein NX029_12045 [Cytobacillus firmus]|nr:hypothetical protein [Cytobacillus firmus]